MARVLVTGGAGFIGSHLVHALVARGDRVRVLDDFSTGRLSNLFGALDAVHMVEGSILDRPLLKEVVEDIDVCVHLAALASVQRSIQHPDRTNTVNVEGSLNVFLACRDAGVRRVVYASSSSVYGAAENVALREDRECRPLSPYGVSKRAVEEYARVCSSLYGLDLVGLRYFNVFGPKQDPASPYAAAIPLFISAIKTSTPPRVFGDGMQSRDFTYVDNVVNANLLAIDAQAPLAGIYNVACGQSTTVLGLIDMLNAILGTSLAPEFKPPRDGEIPWSLADVSKARESFGYAPEVSLREGLERTVGWYM